MDVAVWNVLHDGCITAVETHVPCSLRLTVEISYLCHHLPTQASHLVVALSACEQFEYHPYDGDAITELTTIAALGLGILSAWEVERGVRVACSDGAAGGELVLRYSSAQTTTAEGQPLTQAELESAAGLYWSLWKQRQE